MDKKTYLIEIEGDESANISQYAEELENALLGASSEVEVEQSRADNEAQDFGSTLILILGTPVAVVLANAFRDWLNRRDNAKIHIKTPEREILLENVTARDASKILELLQQEGY
ncbi:MAG: hypothetical protein AAGE84_05240 [Cyanobacteria bacterium P01_G01_bin.39]